MLDSTARPGFKSDDDTIRIPFRFNLDECRHSSHVQELPPSLDSTSNSTKWSQSKNDSTNQYDITYTISASAFDSRGALASTSAPVTVLPLAEPQPPLSPSDFGGEYFMGAASPHESKILRRTPAYRLEVAAQEPEPLSFDPADSGSNGYTNIPFVLKVLPTAGRKLDLSDFPSRCNLRTRLVSRTFVTPDRRNKSMPTLEDALKDDDSHLRTSRTNEQAFTVGLKTWDQYSAGKSLCT